MKYSVVAVIVIFSCVYPQKAPADVWITGGSHNQRVLIEQTYDRSIPSRFHTSAIIPVKLLGNDAFDNYLNNGSGSPSQNEDVDDTVDGIYEDEPTLITLRATQPDQELEYTVAHEYGHYVWQAELTEHQRRTYNRLYQAQKSLGHLVTDYAAYSVNEGFAEAFATYSTCPTLLRAKDSLSYAFIDSILATNQPQNPAKEAAPDSTEKIAGR